MSEIDRSYLDTCAWKPGMFKGKVVYVTGGAGSICKVQAQAMVLLGADAALIGRNEAKTKKAAEEMSKLRDGAKVIGIGNIDVREIASVAKSVEETVKALGRIDFVIAGAAGNFLSDFNHLSANAFKSVVSIDLLGSFNTAKACFIELKKTKGAIIFVSATLHYYGVPMQTHVGAAKAGVDALSNALAVELGPLGIRSNCIAPGAIDNTEGMSKLAPGGSESIVSKIPLQRMGEARDIADATVYLFSPAGQYVTGTVQVVDGAFWHMGSMMGDFYPGVIISQNEDNLTKL